MSNQDVIASFLEYKRVEAGLADSTREAYGYALSTFCSWLRQQKGKGVLHASRGGVRAFIGSCLEAKLSPATVRQRIAVLREFYKHLQRDGVITNNPMLGVELPQAWKRLPKAISETEVRQLLNASDDHDSALALRDRAILETFYCSAIRVDELVSAELANLNLNDHVLSVWGKGSKQRLVPLGRPAALAIQIYLNAGRPLLEKKTPSSRFLFIGRRGTKLTRQRVWQIVNEAAQRADLSDISPHVLRHSAATHMLNHGADLRTIQTILGHADISTTQIYTKVSKEHLRDVLLRCHPRWKPMLGQARLFERPALVSSFIICTECTNLAMTGKTRCEQHLLRARIARHKAYIRTRSAHGNLG